VRLPHNGPPVKTKHFAQLVTLSALWGASFMLIRIASPLLGPNVLAALRIGVATVTLMILMRAMRHRWPLKHWRELAVLGALSVAFPFLLFAWAALQLPAGYSALLNTTAVVFGIFAAAWLKEDTLTVRKLVGCVCGFAGVALIVGLGPVAPSPPVILAALACTAAAACYGISTPLMKRAISRMQPLEITAGIHAVSLLMLLPGAVWSWPQAHFTPGALAAVAVMGVVTSGLAYWLHIRILVHVSPVAAMSPTFMIPVFGVTWGHLFLGEQLSTGIYAGGALVLLASALVTGFNPWQKRLDVVDAKR
jgi:drug/metabolite transporter (DMT)-like permease